MKKAIWEYVTGNVPRQAMTENEKNYSCFAAPERADDGFLHLLGKGAFRFPTACSFTLAIDAPYQFLYVQEGELLLSTGESSFALSDGSAYLFPTNGKSTFDITKGRCLFFHLCLSGAALSEYSTLLPQPLSLPQASACVFSFPSVLSQLMEFTGDANEPFDRCRLSLWLTEILGELAVFAHDPMPVRAAVPEYLLSLKRQLDEDYAAPCSLDLLAAQYGVNRYRICREFTRYFGVSPMRYLNQQRIHAAKRLLLTETIPVHEVGARVGIGNTNHFINLFKRETGTTPLAFRQDAPVSISALHYPAGQDDRPQ